MHGQAPEAETGNLIADHHPDGIDRRPRSRLVLREILRVGVETSIARPSSPHLNPACPFQQRGDRKAGIEAVEVELEQIAASSDASSKTQTRSSAFRQRTLRKRERTNAASDRRVVVCLLCQCIAFYQSFECRHSDSASGAIRVLSAFIIAVPTLEWQFVSVLVREACWSAKALY